MSYNQYDDLTSDRQKDYAHDFYEISTLFVCNLKKLGTELSDEEQNIKFILCQKKTDIGYDCEAGRYRSYLRETLTGYGVDYVKSAIPLPPLPRDTEIIFGAEAIDPSLFTEEEKAIGIVSDLR